MFVAVAVMTLIAGSAPLRADGDSSTHQAPAPGTSGVVHSDFDGDGFADLAIGVPSEDVGSVTDAGAVNVIYGSSAGLSPTTFPPDQVWHQGLPSVEGTAGAADMFGDSLAAGDFNGDGFADLAVGVPGEDVFFETNAGAVNVIYGSGFGLSTTILPDQFWSQKSAGVNGDPEGFDDFGSSLATGDYNADGFADLAVGVPDEDVGSVFDAGAVNVIYGSRAGLSPTTLPDQVWDQDSKNVNGVAEPNDWFGSSLVAGDFDGDGFADLAVGAKNEGVASILSAGSVNVIYGSASGLSPTARRGDQLWDQDSKNVDGVAEFRDYFSGSLATGDFDGDGFADLAVGVTLEDVGSIQDAGAVNVIYGSSSGLSPTIARDDQLWDQSTLGVEGEPEFGDFFGLALAAGDFDGDRFAELAVGVPNETVGSIGSAGAINVIDGSPFGLSTLFSEALLWDQDSSDVEGVAEEADHFGWSLAVAGFGGGAEADLAVGVDWENVGSINDAGAVNVLYGSPAGLSATATPDQLWDQGSPHVEGAPEDSDAIGWSLA